MKPAEELSPVIIGGRTQATNGAKGRWPLVRAFASIMLDSVTEAREFHKIYFSKDQWELIACSVCTGEKIILESCSVCFDPCDEPVDVDTTAFYDFGQGEGFMAGTSKTYIPGVVDRVRSITITRELKMDDDQSSPGTLYAPFLPSYDRLYDRAYAVYDPDPDDHEEDYDDDYRPSLADCYDDLAELELNTRGDGYD